MPKDIEQLLLQEGDVINLREGLEVYASLPQKFVYSNITERSRNANELAETEIIIGEIRKTTKSKYDTHEFIGEYVVTKTNMGGGETRYPNDSYPNGWHVTAKKLKDGKYDLKGKEVNFYQTGFFTAMIKPGEVKPIRKMKQKFE